MNRLIGFNKLEIRIEEENSYEQSIGIIYPGQIHSLSVPWLFYLGLIFENMKIHYLGIDQQYGKISEYMNADPDERAKWVRSDSETIGEYLSEKAKTYNRRIFIAKSLGTAHIFNQIKKQYIRKDDILIFQTPIIPFDELMQVLIEIGSEALIIYGTKDQVMLKRKFPRITTTGNVEVLEIENAGHSFEEETKIAESIDNLKKVMVGIERFLQRTIGDESS